MRYNISQFDYSTEGPDPNSDLFAAESLNINLYLSSLQSGFIGITTIANNLILQDHTNDDSYILVNKEGPIYQEEYELDYVYFQLKDIIEIFLVIPLLLLWSRMTASIFEEKEKKMRETMLIMGMKSSAYFLSWYIRYLITYTIVSLLGSALLYACFPMTPYWVIFILLFLFYNVLLVQSLFIQVFFTKAKVGLIFAIFFFTFQYLCKYSIED